MGKLCKKAQVRETSSTILQVYFLLCRSSKYSAISFDFIKQNQIASIQCKSLILLHFIKIFACFLNTFMKLCVCPPRTHIFLSPNLPPVAPIAQGLQKARAGISVHPFFKEKKHWFVNGL